MDLANAARAPKPTQARRTHAPARDELDTARCGARLAPGIAVNDGAPGDTTCCACRASLHRDGTLPYVRRPRA